MSMKPMRAALALVIGLAGIVVGTPAANAIDAGSSVDLAIAVPITVGPGSTGLISAEELEAYTRPLGELTRQLDAVIDRPVAIGIDPMILASIRILGTSAPESATAWLARLATATNETFALPYADADATLATQAGNGRVLAPQSFNFGIDPSLFAPATDETPSPSPDPTAVPDPDVTPTLPTSDDLTAWPYTFESLGWPRANSVVSSDLPALSAQWESVILSSGNVARDASATSVVDLDSLGGLVSDDPTSSAFAAAASAASTTDWTTAMSQLDAALSAAARVQAGAATVFATLDRGLLADAELMEQTLSSLAATPGVTLVPLSSVADDAASAATIVDQPQDGVRVSTVRGMLDAMDAATQFASIIDDPQLITAPRQLQLLALTSNSWLTNATGWAAATSEFLAQTSDLLDSVQVVESSSFNLLADNAGLPISVSNTLAQAVTVYITVRPETAILAVGDTRVKLVVEPNSQGKGQVPVQAISNGRVQALVTLSSGAGIPIGDPTVADINVQAGWETPIVAGFAILVVAVFGVGIVRNILRRRKAAASESTDTAGDD